MRELTKDEIAILQRHAKWLQSDGEEGEKADLSYTDLSFADLSGTNLSGTNLSNANLSGTNLSYTDLSFADLSNANLSNANLSNANLSNANLSNANLSNANLSNANLSNANLDFSCWPLWCGSRDVKADDRLVAQLLFHVTRLNVTQCSGGVREAMEHIQTMAVSDLFCEYRNDIKKIGE
ncbi:pentapeptide repeat-containing protein [Desulfovibrio sp. SGI.169]|uniref:pentapeptide repeat-containing protein n=1 Tax=Desulfovibrio sp. SGI.169 TaxID=3420561 RepID=UPI003D05389D